MTDPAMPPDLGAAIATQALWLQAWVLILIATNLIALVFIVFKEEGSWRIRYEPMAIVASFMAAGILMGWMYDQVGYVRLLGLAHLVFWTPVYIWVFSQRKTIGVDSLYGKYIHAYLGIAGISLIVDIIDVVRYLMGDGNLM